MAMNRDITHDGRTFPDNVSVWPIHHHVCKPIVIAQKMRKEAAAARVMRRRRVVEGVILIIEKMRLMRTDLVMKMSVVEALQEALYRV